VRRAAAPGSFSGLGGLWRVDLAAVRGRIAYGASRFAGRSPGRRSRWVRLALAPHIRTCPRQSGGTPSLRLLPSVVDVIVPSGGHLSTHPPGLSAEPEKSR
jgi:hypothetical protein